MFEVVLALAIFLAAVATISEVLHNGGKANSKARLSAEAALRADSKMNEVVCGALPLSSVSSSAFDDGDAQWTWSLTVNEAEIIGLLELVVTVQHLTTSGEVNESFELIRLMRDPQVFVDAATTSTGTEGT